MYINVNIEPTPEQIEIIKSIVTEEVCGILSDPKTLKEFIKSTVAAQVKQEVNEVLQSKNFRSTILSKTNEVLVQFFE